MNGLQFLCGRRWWQGWLDAWGVRGKGFSTLSSSQAPVTGFGNQEGTAGLRAGEQVKKPWRRGRITQATFLKTQSPSFSPLSVFLHTICFCQLSTLLWISFSQSLSLAQLYSHSHAGKSGVCKLRLNFRHPFTLLFCSPSHLPYPKYPLLYFYNARSPLCPRFVLLALTFSMSLFSCRSPRKQRSYTVLGRAQLDCLTHTLTHTRAR